MLLDYRTTNAKSSNNLGIKTHYLAHIELKQKHKYMYSKKYKWLHKHITLKTKDYNYSLVTLASLISFSVVVFVYK